MTTSSVFAEVFTSTEFWAALLGVLAAFLLEALRRWWSDNTRKQSAVNEATLLLSQMYTVLKNYDGQVFTDQEPVLAKALGRKPHVFEYLPAVGLGNQDLTLDFGQLSFLLRSHDPDLLNRVLNAERMYLGNIQQIGEHIRCHAEFQRRLASSVRPEDSVDLSEAILVAKVGMDTFFQLKHIAEALQGHLFDDAKCILEIAVQLREAAASHFPIRRFCAFSPAENRAATEVPPHAKPAIWRRLVRRVVRLFRRTRA